MSLYHCVPNDLFHLHNKQQSIYILFTHSYLHLMMWNDQPLYFFIQDYFIKSNSRVVIESANSTHTVSAALAEEHVRLYDWAIMI